MHRTNQQMSKDCDRSPDVGGLYKCFACGRRIFLEKLVVIWVAVELFFKQWTAFLISGSPGVAAPAE